MTRKPKQAKTKGKSDWAKQVQWDMEYAKRQILADGSLDPIFIIHSADKSLAVASRVDPESKRDFYTLMRALCIANDATALSCIAEAWLREVPQVPGEEQSMARATDLLPSEAEDRKEVLISQTTYRDDAGRHSAVRSAEIERDWNGKITGFKDFPHQNVGIDEDEGLVFNILPERLAPPEGRELARKTLPMLAAALGLGLEMMDLEGGSA